MGKMTGVVINYQSLPIRWAKECLEQQALSLKQLANDVDGEFERAVELIISCKGRLIVSGMGKSGHVGAKMAASLSSTGTRTYFIHPGEAFHGDFGMIAPEDIVLLISNSGETEEIVKLLPVLKRFGNPIIGMHGNESSTLAKHAQVNLLIKVAREVCPHNLAPTTSTLAVMAMGDALTIALMKKREFKPEDFARFHPGGSLGRRLLTRVSDVMHTENLPTVSPELSCQEVMFRMTSGRFGLALVCDSQKKLLGIFTDGDLRRIMIKGGDVLNTPIGEIMTLDPVTIIPDTKLVDAEIIMQNHKIKDLPVINDGSLIGLLDIYD